MNYLRSLYCSIASASLEQVYKTKTKNNTYVAVKAQRLNLYFHKKRCCNIKVFTTFFHISTIEYWCWNWRNNDESKALFDEIDYEKEGKCIKVCKLFKDNPNVFILN